MPVYIYRSRIILAIAFAALLFFTGCKKAISDIVTNTFGSDQQLFEQNILNKDFIVDFASDNGSDITSNYTGYHFVLTKTTSYYEGTLTATINTTVYTGTWSCNSDYSQLTINITQPAVPDIFIFLNRSWKFTKKSLPVMELAPWYNTASDPKILHMKRL